MILLEKVLNLLANIEKKVDSSQSEDKTTILELINVLKIVSNELSELKNSYEELDQYINSIDEDLGAIEAMVTNEEEFEEDSFSEDEFIQQQCSNCKEVIYIDKEIYGDRDNFDCPNCHNLIRFQK